MENLKLVDAFTDFVEESTLPYRQMMTYYNCALMEVETKFKVLNEQFSLFYDRNPIESIHTRIKSQSSILKKLQKKNLALTIPNIENNLFDIAGVRVVCAFTEDIYFFMNEFFGLYCESKMEFSTSARRSPPLRNCVSTKGAQPAT